MQFPDKNKQAGDKTKPIGPVRQEGLSTGKPTAPRQAPQDKKRD